MLVSPVEVKKNKGINKYVLTIVTAKRARELNRGDRSVIESPVGSKPVTIALEEILADKIEILRGEK